jgi:hypothetical protein
MLTMPEARLTAVGLVVGLLLCQAASFVCGQTTPAAPAAAAPAIPDTASTLPALASPDLGRGELEIPTEIWNRVRARVEAEDRPIGYTPDEMSQYGRSAFILPAVLQIFRDARTAPRFTGRLSDDLLANAGKVGAFGYGASDGGLGEMTVRCFGLLSVSAGRQTMPDSLDPVPWPAALEGAEAEHWNALPSAVRDLTARLYLAAEEARPWLRTALNGEELKEVAGATDLESARTADLYRIAMAHQTAERFGQSVSLDPATFQLFDQVDLAYLDYATVVWTRRLEFALRAYQRGGGSELVRGKVLPTFRVSTALGDVLIGGTGDDVHTAPAFLTIDLGGNDLYGPGFGAPLSLESPTALILDLAGDDRYLDPSAAERPAGAPADTSAPVPSFGAGVFGLGVLCDLGGDDEYAVRESGLGRGCFGTGILIDFAGNDRYRGGRWTQGAAHAGVGILLDLAGDDIYSCAEQSQGLGATLGVGLLLDLAGNDRYVARDDGNISELYLGQSVAMSQGCGYGRRADLGDGHSLGGGFGLLVDGGGDDSYHAQVWSQGCGYWWGVGVLEDRSGNDQYRNGKYSSGAAAHFAIGVHVDLSGDDQYNLGNDTAKNQYQGHARDGSMGIFVDGDGNDRYEFRTHCAGSGDLGSIGLFWDRRGDDSYRDVSEVAGQDPWAVTPPLGSTTQYEPFRSFRDDLPVYGIFLDTGGRDTYDTRGRGGDNLTWRTRRNPNAWGIGIDGESYPAAAARPDGHR